MKNSNKSKGSVLISFIFLSIVLMMMISSIFISLSFNKEGASLKKMKDRKKNLSHTLQTFIEQSGNCRSILRNKTLSHGSYKTVKLPKFKEQFIDNKPDLRTIKINFSIKVQSSSLREVWIFNPLFKLRTYRATLRMHFTTKEQISLSPIDIPLFVNLDSHSRIQSCYGENTKAHVCETQGFAWDDRESKEQYKCKPDLICQTARASSSKNCPERYTATNIGNSKYLCLWCNPHRN